MKKVLLVLAAIIALSLPAGVYAVTSNSEAAQNVRSFCGFGVDASSLTEQQKADLEESFNQMLEVRKESINRMIANGLMTKEEGALALERLNDMIEYHKENGYGYGMGMMGGTGDGRGMMRGNGYGRGMMGGYKK